MRRLLAALLIVLMLAVPALAVDSIAYKWSYNVREGYYIHHWTASTTDNPGVINEAATGLSINIHGWIMGFKVVPSATSQPDSSYNVELHDARDFDYLFNTCAALDGGDQADIGNVNTPVTNSGAWAFIGGDKLTLYADGLGDCSGTCAFDLYLYVKPNKEK